MKSDPFSLNEIFNPAHNSTIICIVLSLVERLLDLKKLSEVYQKLDKHVTPQKFIDNLLNKLLITYRIDSIPEIKTERPLMIVSNHPFGAIEGLILMHCFSNKRTDIRIMANVFLKRIKPLSEIILGVLPFKDKQATKKNLPVMREIIQWLKDNHCLITFPAGNVSHFHFRKALISDGLWDVQIARIARSTGADVLPVFFNGRNSLPFYMLGPRLHALLYVRELLNKSGKCIEIHAGEIIQEEEIKITKSDHDLIKLFRERCESLSMISLPETDPVD